jgi:hypothetical protein
MLEYLLVLGQVPGTKLQLTFLEVLFFSYFLILCLIWSLRYKIGRLNSQYFQLLRLRRQAKRELRKLGIKTAKSTHRRVLTLPRHTSRPQISLPGQQVRRAY